VPFIHTDQSGVTTLRHDGELLLIAVLENLADLLGRLWLENEAGLTLVLSHPIGVEGFEVVFNVLGKTVHDGIFGT
jgi:hypothetical protein